MNLISLNFRNLFTIGLISILGSVVVRFAESASGVDIDRDGQVDSFSTPFSGGAPIKKGRVKK